MTITYEQAVEHFDYDSASGTIVRKFKGGQRKAVRCDPIEGGKIRFAGRDYRAHRIAWLIAYGTLPSLFIDHINGDPADNRLCNLREATDAQNKRNVGRRVHNTSGFKGVTWDKANRRWLAHATLDGKGIHLGRHATKEGAAEAYRSFAKKNHGEFYKEPTS